jgi:hypothetical protein
MLRFNILARKATKLSTILALCANSIYAQTPSVIDDNAITPINRAILVTVKEAGAGTPLISRTTGSATSACLENTGGAQQPATFSLAVSGIAGVTSTTYTWRVKGGLQITSAANAQTVTVKPILVNGKNVPGKLYVDYVVNSTVLVPWTSQNCNTCNGVTSCTPTSGTTSYSKSETGTASVNLAQKFNIATVNSLQIVGPRCIGLNEDYTYSIAPIVSSYEASDGYNWKQTQSGGGFSLLSNIYSSLDKSSITVSTSSLTLESQLPTKLSVNVGACNQDATGYKELVFSRKMANPVVSINSVLYTAPVCQPANNPIVTTAVAGIDLDQVDVVWSTDIVGATLAGPSDQLNATFNVGSGSIAGNIYLQAKARTVAKNGKATLCNTNDAPIVKTFVIQRGAGNGNVSGPQCVTIGQNTFQVLVDGLTATNTFNWTLPAGMTAVGSATANPLIVNVASAVNNATISATVISTNGCTSTITSLPNINTAPKLSGIGGATCVPVNANGTYTPTLANGTTADYYTWSQTGGITGGGGSFYFPATFTTGTIEVIANKSNCPSSDKVTLSIKANPSTVAIAAPSPSKTCLNKGLADAVTFTAPTGYDSYIWTAPAGWVGTSTSSSITYTVPAANTVLGPVTVRGTITGCGTSLASTGVSLTTIGAGVAVVISSLNPGGAIILSTANLNAGLTTPNYSYKWFKDGVDVNNSTFTLTLPNSSTVAKSYTVQATNITTSCSTLSAPTTSTYSNNRMAEEESDVVEAASLNVSPNPTSAEFTMALAGMAGADVRIIEQATGKEVKRFTASSNVINVATATWAAGVYVVTATSGANRLVKSVVVSH